MKGDFSRLTFNADKQFSHVRMQQGRVMLDADWNELNDILLYYMRTLGADLIGPHGGPEDNLGFKIELAANDDFSIGMGRYYVDGISCDQVLEKFEDKPVTYLHQPYYPGEKPSLEGDYLAYLDVWERHVTYLEDSLIREVALGGPDTATRAQIIWQVKTKSINPPDIFDLNDNNPNPACGNLNLGKFRGLLKSNPPTLKARVKKPSSEDTDPCVTSPESRYRGAENQLYRVEIHAGNADGKATFKWSRENGSVVARWLQTKGSDLIVSGIRDTVKGFQAGDWIELTHDDLELRGEHGVMVKLSNVEGDVLTIDPITAIDPVPSDLSKLKNPKVRRWEQKEVGEITLENGTIHVTESDSDWIMLEDGLEIQFQLPENETETTTYRTGDYWLIPARVATGDIEWPGEAHNPEALPPHGIEHHYAPLGFVSVDAVTDLRKVFAGLALCVNNR